MLALLCAALVTIQDPPPAPVPPSAYADTGTANLVARARARRERAERLVTGYTARVNQRIGMGMRALRRDRMLFHQQLTARIHWRRDSTSTIEMTGARQAIPIAVAGVHVPQALTDQASILAFDPAEDYLRLVGNDPDGMLYPLADSAERYYRYESGDTTYITLPTGREIRLIELKVTARRPGFRWLQGSLWLDAESWGLVRMVVRPSRAFDLELDGDPGDADDVPGIIKPVRFGIEFITFEYGLYEARWWLPRLMAMDGELTMGSFLRAPARFERVYEIERVTGGGEPPSQTLARWRAGSRRPDMDSIAREDSLALAPDSIAAFAIACALQDSISRDSVRRRRGQGVNVEVMVSARTCLRRRILEASGHAWKADLAVVVPEDTMALLRSPELGAPILDMGDIISERELRQLGDAIGALPGEQWQVRSILRSASPRYNRVEGLSAGIRGGLDLGKLQLEAQARLGLADLEPNGELTLRRPGRAYDWRVAGYRRLRNVDPPARALGFGNSLTALLFGRDDGDYYRTMGAELVVTPGSTRSDWMELRLFGEAQRGAVKETDASLRHLFDSSYRFRTNITAAPADQVGAALTLRGFRTFSTAFGVGAELFVEGQGGTAQFARSALTLRSTAPVAGLIVGWEAAAGLATTEVTPQALWYMGGPQTLRGYGGNAMRGESFWRGRFEVANNFPAVRLSLFSDVAWAGPRGTLTSGRPLKSAGLGASLFDGLLRVDWSVTLRRGPTWRLDFYADGLL